jgi:hypothetical protein
MWVEALLGRNLVDGEPVTAEDILDKTMDIYLGVKVSETSGKSFNRIKDVIVRVPAPAPTLTQELEARRWATRATTPERRSRMGFRGASPRPRGWR